MKNPRNPYGGRKVDETYEVDLSGEEPQYRILGTVGWVRLTVGSPVHEASLPLRLGQSTKFSFVGRFLEVRRMA